MITILYFKLMYLNEISIYKNVLLYTYVLLLKGFILSRGMFLENI